MKTSSNPCKTFELAISALIDGELESPEQLPAIDHLLECASCQDFYGRARALGSMVTFGEASAEPAPPEVWERIATETGLAEPNPESLGATPWWRRSHAMSGTLGLAAGLILALAIWFLRPVVLEESTPVVDREGGVVNVVLEQDRGSMSDERFLELTTELLRADRGYHRKMFEIMRVVDDLAVRPEGSGDEPLLAMRDGSRGFSIGEGDSESVLPWSGDQL